MIQLFKDKKYWKETLFVLIGGIFINIACFMMCSLTGHCANESSEYYPFYWGTNEIGLQEDIDAIIGYMSDSNSEFWGYDNCFIRVVKENNGYYDTIYYAVYYYSDYWRLVADVNQQQLYSFDIQKVSNEQGTDSYTTVTFARGFNNSQFLQKVYNSANFQNCQSSNYNHIISYYSTFNTLYDFYDNVIITSPPQDIVVGDYTDLPPLDDILNNLTDTYTPDYSPVYPNIDNNKTDLENEQSFFDTLSQGITQNFNNLGANLQKFFNKLQQKLTDVSNSISTNIHNGFATLMQNIKDFFGPKLDKIIELLTKLVNDDEEDVISTWENTQLYSDFDRLSQTVNNGFGVWQDTDEPNTYKIAFHVEQIPLLHCDTVQYIDLGLFSPVIPYIRSIMWALLVYSVFYTVIDSIANYLNGGDE